MLKLLEVILWAFLLLALGALVFAPLLTSIGKKEVPPLVKGK